MGRLWAEYFAPVSVREALDILQRYNGQALVIAGGTDLIVQLRKENRSVPAVVDVTAVEELEYLAVEEGEVVVGAAVTHSQALASPLLQAYAPHLVEAIRTIGSVQIRNMGTIVGNVVNASPSGDTIPPLITLDARVVVQSALGQREEKVETFLQGPRRTSLKPGELVSHIRFPIPKQGCAFAFEKLGLRQAMHISVNNAALLLQWQEDKVAEARIALGAVAPTVVRARKAEEFLVGRQLGEDVITQAAVLAKEATSPIDDIRGTAEYRVEMAAVLVRKMLRRVRQQAQEETIG